MTDVIVFRANNAEMINMNMTSHFPFSIIRSLSIPHPITRDIAGRAGISHLIDKGVKMEITANEVMVIIEPVMNKKPGVRFRLSA
jgi:hypothetical protein